MLESYGLSTPVPKWISDFKHPQLWKFLGFASSTVGLLCYAPSSSFQHLYGEWNLLKIILFAVASLIISYIMLFAKKLQVLGNCQLEALVVLAVLLITSLYSLFDDRKVTGEPDELSVISNGAFTLMAVSFSIQIGLRYEAGVSTFFLGCFTIQLMKISLTLVSVAAVFHCVVFALRSYVPLEIDPDDAEERVAKEGTENFHEMEMEQGVEHQPLVSRIANRKRAELEVCLHWALFLLLENIETSFGKSHEAIMILGYLDFSQCAPTTVTYNHGLLAAKNLYLLSQNSHFYHTITEFPLLIG